MNIMGWQMSPSAAVGHLGDDLLSASLPWHRLVLLQYGCSVIGINEGQDSEGYVEEVRNAQSLSS